MLNGFSFEVFEDASGWVNVPGGRGWGKQNQKRLVGGGGGQGSGKKKGKFGEEVAKGKGVKEDFRGEHEVLKGAARKEPVVREESGRQEGQIKKATNKAIEVVQIWGKSRDCDCLESTTRNLIHRVD